MTGALLRACNVRLQSPYKQKQSHNISCLEVDRPGIKLVLQDKETVNTCIWCMMQGTGGCAEMKAAAPLGTASGLGEVHLGHPVLGCPQAVRPVHLALQCHTVSHNWKKPSLRFLHSPLTHCSELTACTLFLSYTRLP